MTARQLAFWAVVSLILWAALCGGVTAIGGTR